MAWKIKRSPILPAIPAFQHPGRCMNCGHLGVMDTERGINEEHVDGIGCLVEGGTKYVEDEDGTGKHVCSCLEFVPAPAEEIEIKET